MGQPWFQKLFGNLQTQQPDSTQTKAANGDAEAQFSLGSGYASVTGTVPDYAQAARWYLQAANQDHVPAQFALGTMFAVGKGVPRNDGEAMLWIRRAAQQGHAAAQHALGVRHRRASFASPPSNAVESNLEAFKWFHLAAAQRHAGSDAELESITLGMTWEQVLEGNRRAASFVAGGSNSIAAEGVQPG